MRGKAPITCDMCGRDITAEGSTVGASVGIASPNGGTLTMRFALLIDHDEDVCKDCLREAIKRAAEKLT